MKNNWKVWLNINDNANYKYIGKNIWFEGDDAMIFVSENISIIGYGKIFNEPELQRMVGKKEDRNHPLEIIVEVYKKYGFEDMLELIEGDYSFLLLDYNIIGEESWLYIVKDPFGIYPLYYYENQNNTSKKVQFDIEMKYYGFSSSEYFENYKYKSFISGHYQRFIHSHKVSANWKINHHPILFYKLPFFSLYNTDKDDISLDKMIEYENQEIKISIEKRLRWITNYKPIPNKKIGVLSLNPNTEKMNMLHYLDKKGFDIIPITPLNIQNKDNSFMCIDNKADSMFQIEYIEREYPTIISRLKMILKSNDPYVIRSHFIPSMIAKYLNENMPEINHVFLGDLFTFDWIKKSYLDRRKWIMQIYIDERLKGWTQVFLSYGIELYMPFLDRVLIQNIKPSTIL